VTRPLDPIDLNLDPPSAAARCAQPVCMESFGPVSLVGYKFVRQQRQSATRTIEHPEHLECVFGIRIVWLILVIVCADFVKNGFDLIDKRRQLLANVSDGVFINH
jgi:hypothetical protein